MAKKRVYCNKWPVDILEQIASSCNIASNARTETDWKLFLEAIYDAIHTLEYHQRVVLLLSQEMGIALADIARILDMPLSTTAMTLHMAVDKIVTYLKGRSLVNKNMFRSKALSMIYIERLDLEEAFNETPELEFHTRAAIPWFYPKNFLFEAIFGIS